MAAGDDRWSLFDRHCRLHPIRLSGFPGYDRWRRAVGVRGYNHLTARARNRAPLVPGSMADPEGWRGMKRLILLFGLILMLVLPGVALAGPPDFVCELLPFIVPCNRETPPPPQPTPPPPPPPPETTPRPQPTPQPTVRVTPRPTLRPVPPGALPTPYASELPDAASLPDTSAQKETISP